MSESVHSKEKSKAIKRLTDKLTKEMLWVYILRLLQERPLYGYEIKNLITQRFAFSPATVSGYAIIYRLVRDDLIESQKRDDSPRKYYTITENGRQAMREAKAFLERTIGTVFDLTE